MIYTGVSCAVVKTNCKFMYVHVIGKSRLCAGSYLTVNIPASDGEYVCELVCDISCCDCEFVIIVLCDWALSVILCEGVCLWDSVDI